MQALYRAALGPVQLPRYLALFERFDRLGRAPAGWNPVASLATLNWMLLHHLWTAALIYVALVEGLALLIFGVGRPLLHWPEQVEWGLIAAFALFAIALPGLFGDALLHSEIRKRVARALVAAQSIPDACAILSRQASSWRRLKWIAAANLLLFAALALAWTLVPPNGWNRPPPAATDSGVVEKAAPALPLAALPAAERPQPAQPAGSDAASTAFLSPSPATPAASSAEPAMDASAPSPPDAVAESPATTEPAPTTPSAPTVVAPADVAATAPQRRAGKQAAKPPASAAAPASVSASSSTAPVAGPPAKSAPASPEAVPATSSSAAPAAEASASASTSAAPLGKAPGYYLNVGVFAQEANARRAQAKLLNANLPAFRQTFDTRNGERTRVRVGPFDTPEQAQKAASQIRSLQLEAVMYRQRG